jgi:hypothetical protein
LQHWFQHRRKIHCSTLAGARQCAKCAENYNAAAAARRKRSDPQDPENNHSADAKRHKPDPEAAATQSRGPTNPTGPVLIIHVNAVLRHLIRHGGLGDNIPSVLQRHANEIQTAAGWTGQQPVVIWCQDGTGPQWRNNEFPTLRPHRGEELPAVTTALMHQCTPPPSAWNWGHIPEASALDLIALLLDRASPRPAVVITDSRSGYQFLQYPNVRLHRLRGDFLDTAACERDLKVPPTTVPLALALIGSRSVGAPGIRGVGPAKAAEMTKKITDWTTFLTGPSPSNPFPVGTRLHHLGGLVITSRQTVQDSISALRLTAQPRTPGQATFLAQAQIWLGVTTTAAPAATARTPTPEPEGLGTGDAGIQPSRPPPLRRRLRRLDTPPTPATPGIPPTPGNVQNQRLPTPALTPGAQPPTPGSHQAAHPSDPCSRSAPITGSSSSSSSSSSSTGSKTHLPARHTSSRRVHPRGTRRQPWGSPGVYPTAAHNRGRAIRLPRQPASQAMVARNGAGTQGMAGTST